MPVNFVRLSFALGTSSRLLPNEERGGERRGGGDRMGREEETGEEGCVCVCVCVKEGEEGRDASV